MYITKTLKSKAELAVRHLLENDLELIEIENTGFSLSAKEPTLEKGDLGVGAINIDGVDYFVFAS